MSKKVSLERLERVRARLARQGLDAMLVAHGETIGDPNVRYLSGFSGSSGMLLIGRTDAIIITDGRYFEQVEEEVTAFALEKLPVGVTYNGFLCDTITKMGIRTLGFDPNHMLYSTHQQLANELSGVELRPSYNIVEDLRIVKSEEEIDFIRKACKIAIEAFLKLIQVNVKGRTERELAADLEHEMRRLGAEKTSFETILCAGPRSSIIHGKPSDNQFKPGDLVIVDFGAVYEGYCSDLTRTCVVGEATTEQQELFSIVKRAQHAAARAAVPGAIGKDVDAVARDLITEAGYGDKFGHGLGHGIGLLVHESPQLGPISEIKLRANMLTTVEPGIYFPGKWGLRLEDDFIVTDGGGVRLSDGLPQELFVLKYD